LVAFAGGVDVAVGVEVSVGVEVVVMVGVSVGFGVEVGGMGPHASSTRIKIIPIVKDPAFFMRGSITPGHEEVLKTCRMWLRMSGVGESIKLRYDKL
jgi:hypothetical protein